MGKWRGLVTQAFTTPEGISLSRKLADKNPCYISDSAWSLRARHPPKQPSRTRTGKASSSTVSFFSSFTDHMSTFPLWSSQYLKDIVQVEVAVMRLNELCIYLLLPSLFSLGFSVLLCFFFSPPSHEIIFYKALFFSSAKTSFRGEYPHNYLRLQPMEKLWEKEGKQSKVRWQWVLSGQRSTGFKRVHSSSQTDAGFAPVWMPRIISQYHPPSGEELAVWWPFPPS